MTVDASIANRRAKCLCIKVFRSASRIPVGNSQFIQSTYEDFLDSGCLASVGVSTEAPNEVRAITAGVLELMAIQARFPAGPASARIRIRLDRLIWRQILRFACSLRTNLLESRTLTPTFRSGHIARRGEPVLYSADWSRPTLETTFALRASVRHAGVDVTDQGCDCVQLGLSFMLGKLHEQVNDFSLVSVRVQ